VRKFYGRPSIRLTRVSPVVRSLEGGGGATSNHLDGDRKSPIPGIVPVPNGLFWWLINGG